jgi:hypothetical protein
VKAAWAGERFNGRQRTLSHRLDCLGVEAGWILPGGVDDLGCLGGDHERRLGPAAAAPIVHAFLCAILAGLLNLHVLVAFEPGIRHLREEMKLSWLSSVKHCLPRAQTLAGDPGCCHRADAA